MSRFVAIPEGRDAYEQALRLRSLGLSYNAIAKVLGEYHGLPIRETTLRANCRRRGAVPRPRGIPIHQQNFINSRRATDVRPAGGAS
jgi:hypothetical protein